MDPDTVIGLALVAFAMALLCVLVIWSIRRIDRISRSGLSSARAIEKELDGGR